MHRRHVTGAVLQFTPLDRLGVALTVTQLVLGAANGLISAGMLAAAALLSWRDVSTPSPVRKTYILDRT